MPIKKLNIGVTATPKATRPSHPLVHVDETTEQLLTQWVRINPQFKELKNQCETLTTQLAPLIKQTYFTHYAGLAPDSKTMLVNVNGSAVKLITKSRYTTKLAEEAPILEALGPKFTSKYFHQATVLKLDLDKVPEDKQETFAQRVIALAEEMGVSDAVSATQCIQPTAGFHETRCVLLTPEQNCALDKVLPFTAYPML